MTYFILSDDLTGAAGVASMVGPGLAVAVNLERYEIGMGLEFPCVAINLNVREKSEREARKAAAEALILARDSKVALRIDSALRGAVKGLVEEIASRGKLLVTDTIPEYGRRTENGITVLGDSEKDLQGRLSKAGTPGWIVVADSATSRDLVRLAKRCESEHRIPVDPGPLVSLVARRSISSEDQPSRTHARRRPHSVAFVIGTRDRMTLRQLRYIEREGHRIRRPSPVKPGPVDIFAFSFDGDPEVVDSAFIESLRSYDALVLSGGTTASFVLEKSGFSCIVSGGQVQPLLSTGRVRGGLLDGKLVVLKGGFIGDEKTYKTILDWLAQS